jgi:hypothetical protein
MPFPENVVLVTPLLGDPVEVVLGVLFGWWARGPEERHVLRVGVLGTRVAVSAHMSMIGPPSEPGHVAAA